MNAVLATFRAAVAESFANRAAFWTQLTMMVANNLVWVGFWVLFFDRVGDVRGWDAGGVLLLFAVLTTSAGLVLGFLGNARHLGDLAAHGELDAVLTLPTHPLTHLLVRRFVPLHLGDLVFGIGLFLAAGVPSWQELALFVVGVVASATLLTGFLVAVGSLAFFGGRAEPGELGFHAMILLASYPADIFSGATKGLLYTAVPAAFVSTVPAELVEDFELVDALLLLGVAAAFAFIGWAVFTVGLRRYTSGSVWTRA